MILKFKINTFLLVLFSKYIFMVSLIFLYIPFFKYLCGNIEILKISNDLISTSYFEIYFNFISFHNSTNLLYLEISNNFSLFNFYCTEEIYEDSLNYFRIINPNINTLFESIDNSYQLNTIKEIFFTTSTSSEDVLFYPLQRKVYSHENETSLVFFRIINKSNHSINGISTYTIFPIDYLPYIRKLQCFCFDEILISPNEIIDLPVLFYLESSNININKLNFCYTFLEIK